MRLLYLANIVMANKDVSSRQVSVDKSFICQVVHSECHLLGVAQKKMGSIRRNDTVKSEIYSVNT